MDIAELFQLLAAGHAGLTALDYVWNAVFGAIGAATAYLADTEGEVFLPRYDREQNSIELGALGRVLIGAGGGGVDGLFRLHPVHCRRRCADAAAGAG
jgi:hypothetical protein